MLYIVLIHMLFHQLLVSITDNKSSHLQSTVSMVKVHSLVHHVLLVIILVLLVLVLFAQPILYHAQMVEVLLHQLAQQ